MARGDRYRRARPPRFNAALVAMDAVRYIERYLVLALEQDES